MPQISRKRLYGMRSPGSRPACCMSLFKPGLSLGYADINMTMRWIPTPLLMLVALSVLPFPQV